MTANAITTTTTKAFSSLGEIIPSIPKLIELGFTPEILLGFSIVVSVVYIASKAIDSGYYLNGAYDVKQERYEFSLSPVRVEV